jgi:spore maturation protein CgeB
MRSLRIAFFLHTLRSDWNNGNAHFLRGLARALVTLGHHVSVFEPQGNWSTQNLLAEPNGQASLDQFAATYPELPVTIYSLDTLGPQLADHDIVIVHEWNEPALIARIHSLRNHYGYKTLFHDTHHRASSSPEQIRLLQVDEFHGVLAFGEALRTIYREQWHLPHVWTLHEAADTTVFHPREAEKTTDLVWIGNWGDDERTRELHTYLIDPAAQLPHRRFTIYGVRYPQPGLDALARAGITYGGYLPNLEAPRVYAQARLTAHVPRQQYTTAMQGIPTIRVFEALASGIPLISAPWPDTELLFTPGDYVTVGSTQEMTAAIEHLLTDDASREAQIAQGLHTIRNRHTCLHRAQQLTEICHEVLAS